MTIALPSVMAGLVPPARPKPLRRGEGPAIHEYNRACSKNVDGRDKPGHDVERMIGSKA